ncbi:MAG: hypothetical protein OHK006_04600 [Thermodesulfovibrionales bacterium]
MQWTQDLSTGLDDVDEQHRELIDRINGLVAAIKQSVCRQTIGGVIQFLEDYIGFHFGLEEEKMKRSGYPGFEHHRSQHDSFVRAFAELKGELLKLEGGKKPGSYDLSVATNQVVVDWILDHIRKTDRAFGDFLRNKEAAPRRGLP